VATFDVRLPVNSTSLSIHTITEVRDVRVFPDHVVVIGFIKKRVADASSWWKHEFRVPIECCVNVIGARPDDNVAYVDIDLELNDDRIGSDLALHSTMCAKVCVAVEKTGDMRCSPEPPMNCDTD
jgi:hypothetical protein